jgi:hypothetical protein
VGSIFRFTPSRRIIRKAEFPFRLRRRPWSTRGLLNPIQPHDQTRPSMAVNLSLVVGGGRTFIVSPTSILPIPHNIILHSIILNGSVLGVF